MATVELIYDRECPNVARARAHLLRAFAEGNTPVSWIEWERSDPASPPYARGYGSPTVLVDGADVAGAEPSEEVSCCRLYPGGSGGMEGVPPVEAIAAALRAADGETGRDVHRRAVGWRRSLAAVPGIGAALLPVGVCPACWPAYAGLVGAMGLGFLLKTAYLLPATVLFLLMAVGALALRAGSRHGHGPFGVGLAGAVIIVAGKFVFALDAVVYGGIVLLVAGSVWNVWPQRTAGRNGAACPACAPGGQACDTRQSGAKGMSS